jgi:tight adherence protein C
VRVDAVDSLDVDDLVLLHGYQRRRTDGVGPATAAAARLVPLVRRWIGPRLVARLQRQIDLAGRPDGMTVDGVLRRFVLWAFLCVPLALLFLIGRNVVGVVLSIVIVVVMPLARLARARRQRQERIERDLPDFLDIVAVTVSAGVSFRPALQRVAERYGGPLADEIGLTLAQLANGASRREAFENLRARNECEPLSQFVTALLQSEELGAPLAETLNQIALDTRRESAQRMRRRAARAVPKVTLVTSMVLVPGALVLVIVGIIVGSDVDLGSLLGGLG